MANNNKILNKQIFKKWWFWVIVVVVLGIIGLTSGGGNQPNDTTADNGDNSSQTTGTLPVVDKADYTDKEGLVAFKDLASKGYTVTAKYVNEAVPATNQDFTEQFTSADVNSCSDRLGFDAYTVSDLTQTGDSIALTLGNTPNSSQTCPAGTTDDLN